jgi:formylglycine-generating enzyme required for sulfatase activity
MQTVGYRWNVGGRDHDSEMVYVQGTRGRAYRFGDPAAPRLVEVQDFWIGRVPVTWALWTHIMGDNDDKAHLSRQRVPELPLENISWGEITRPGGFLDRINQSPVRAAISAGVGPAAGPFRLPSETEWEYAARGGPNWTDGFVFSGGNDPDAVAWYDRRHGDHTQPVGQKAPNQLGIYDLSGNVWEWCQDVYTRDVEAVPADGTPYVGPGDERVLRGGCFHNWAVHCTVFKRYYIAPDFRDGCIGLRLVLSSASPATSPTPA